MLKFIGSETTGLNADVNGDVVSCIYADVSQKGTQEFKLKFEVIAETKETSLGITNVKFRAKDKESSYTEKDTQGINDVLKIATVAGTTKISTITPTPTPVPAKTGKLPNAGAKEQTGYVLLVCSILLIASAVFKEKERKIKRILKDVGM